MKIKSKKAEIQVKDISRQLSWCELNDIKFGVSEYEDSRAYKVSKAIKDIVIIAEQDARDRAIKAFKITCEKYDCEKDLCFSGYKCEDTHCSKRDKFLKSYDSE